LQDQPESELVVLRIRVTQQQGIAHSVFPFLYGPTLLVEVNRRAAAGRVENRVLKDKMMHRVKWAYTTLSLNQLTVPAQATRELTIIRGLGTGRTDTLSARSHFCQSSAGEPFPATW
jgi:hypothetical protein